MDIKYKEYWISKNQCREEFYIKKDGFLIATFNTLENAKKEIDNHLISKE